MKNTGSRHFEEAYFVLRSDAGTDSATTAQMIDEANRIIKENFGKKRGGIFSKRRYVAAFLIGCAVTLALCSVLYFCLR